VEKTYRILSHTEPLPIDEIRQLYKGYWVYLVKAELSESDGLISGVPVIIGQTPHDGVEDGIYEKYRAKEYEKRADLSLLPNKGFISSLRIAGGENA
jgi:hypothetical protein